MRTFNILYDKEYKDKVVGGKLTLREGAYFGISLTLFTYLFFYNTGYIVEGNINVISFLIRLIISISCLILSGFLAFYKVEKLNLDEYIVLKTLYLFRGKTYIYKK